MIKFLTIFLSVFLLISCASDEEKAREIYNQAIKFQMEENTEAAVDTFSQIVKKYPNTETSLKASEELLAYKRVESIINNHILEIQKENITLAIKMFKFDNGVFPEKLKDLIEKPSNHVRWREGGYFAEDIEEAIKILNHFEYRRDKNRNFVLEIKDNEY